MESCMQCILFMTEKIFISEEEIEDGMARSATWLVLTAILSNLSNSIDLNIQLLSCIHAATSLLQYQEARF